VEFLAEEVKPFSATFVPFFERGQPILRTLVFNAADLTPATLACAVAPSGLK